MKALVLGGVAPHIRLIENLQHRGYTVGLADYYTNPPARAAADDYFQISTLDMEAVYELAKSYGAEVIMATNVDHANVIMCTVAERLGLPHPYSSETARLTTDKGLMKERMREFAIPTSEFLTVRSVEEIPFDTLRYPLVVKPVDNNGSKGVKRVDTDEALTHAVSDALGLSRTGAAIIEGFNAGREIQVDCYASGGVAHVLTIREKLKMPNKGGLAMQVYGSVVPPAVSDAVTQACHTIAQQIVDAFGLSHTPFFFQTIVEGDHVSVLELSPRIGGGLSYKLILDRTGVDVIDVAVESYFGDPTVREMRADAPSLASTIVYAKDGVFSHVTGVEDALAAGDIVSWDQMAEEGTEFGGYMDSRNRVGAFYSAGQGHEELCERVERANQKIDVISKDGTSIKVKGLYLHL